MWRLANLMWAQEQTIMITLKIKRSIMMWVELDSIAFSRPLKLVAHDLMCITSKTVNSKWSACDRMVGH